VAILPVNPPNLTVDYALTTFRHWPQMSQNITSRGIVLTQPENYTATDGAYILFSDGDSLTREQV